MPRLRSSRRLQADSETVESGRLSSSSESEGESSEIEESIGESNASADHPIPFSELDPDPGFEFKHLMSSSLPASTEMFRCSKESSSATNSTAFAESSSQLSQRSGRNSALEDELMLLRLLDLHKTSRENSSAPIYRPENDTAASLTASPFHSESPLPVLPLNHNHRMSSSLSTNIEFAFGATAVETPPSTPFLPVDLFALEPTLRAERGDFRPFETVTRDCSERTTDQLDKIAPRPSLVLDQIGRIFILINVEVFSIQVLKYSVFKC